MVAVKATAGSVVAAAVVVMMVVAVVVVVTLAAVAVVLRPRYFLFQCSSSHRPCGGNIACVTGPGQS